MDPTLRLLRDLVAIDSVNPSLVAGGAGEAQVAQAIAHALKGGGLDVEVTDVLPGRPNVVGVLEGRAPGPALMFCGHTDTVGVAGMKAPFDPIVRDGRLYGRGAQDMKGGVAAMIGAALHLAAAGQPRAGRLIVAAVIDEEHASAGAEALVATWRADAAVVTEPTELSIAVGHKGFAWLDIETRGRAAHGSRPHDGRDAILRMGRVLGRLERLDRELQARAPHALLGTGSLHASLISGGRELSSYPDVCALQMERRTLPGETPAQVFDEVQRILGELRREDPDFDASASLTFSRHPYELAPNHDLTRRLNRAVSSCGLTSAITGMTFWTDAAILGEAGIASVLFGPSGAGLHSTEEYVLVDDVLKCRDALLALARDYCAG
ncbi:MAG: ArgE/DapE family deacylase [Acidobacteria bacterium]|nr:ArgE/DapE family deacylase [Acidobacteriota bacterium]